MYYYVNNVFSSSAKLLVVKQMYPYPRLKVVKRDGREEDFIPEKITVSVLKSGAPIDVARKITILTMAKLLEHNVEKVTAKELTKIVLELLKKESEEWYHNWIVFDRAIKRRKTEEELKE